MLDWVIWILIIYAGILTCVAIYTSLYIIYAISTIINIMSKQTTHKFENNRGQTISREAVAPKEKDDKISVPIMAPEDIAPKLRKPPKPPGGFGSSAGQ